METASSDIYHRYVELNSIQIVINIGACYILCTLNIIPTDVMY